MTVYFKGLLCVCVCFQMVSGLKLELTSVSQGLQTLYSRTDKTEQLEQTVVELKKNMSLEGNSRLLATLLDEQGKKVGRQIDGQIDRDNR